MLIKHVKWDNFCGKNEKSERLMEENIDRRTVCGEGLKLLLEL
jgi:hypothetical protein